MPLAAHDTSLHLHGAERAPSRRAAREEHARRLDVTP
jgi:hypothetical protein